MEKITAKKIKRVSNIIAKHYKPEKIILFGSFAWGKPGPNSDVDLFVIKKTKKPFLRRITELDSLFSRRDFPMDFLIYTPAQVKKRLKMGDFFVEEILEKGKILYEKTQQKRVKY